LRVPATFPLDNVADPCHSARHTKGDFMIRTLICAAAAILTTAWAGSGLGLGLGTLAATAGLITAAYLTLWAWVDGEVGS